MSQTNKQREEEDGRDRDAIRRRYGVAFEQGGSEALRKALHEDGMKRLRMGRDFLTQHIRRIAYGRKGR